VGLLIGLRQKMGCLPPLQSWPEQNLKASQRRTFLSVLERLGFSLWGTRGSVKRNELRPYVLLKTKLKIKMTSSTGQQPVNLYIVLRVSSPSGTKINC
jgi:hypothetical protein